jgi:DeoR/GlpR family transcriptional regulator of sugar metabolism
MSVFLDVGTTAVAVAREMLRRDALRDLTVITSGLSIETAPGPALAELRALDGPRIVLA